MTAHKSCLRILPMVKTILISGATSGIGRFLAAHFANQGHTVFMHGRDKAKLDNLRRELKHDRVYSLDAELDSAQDIDRMFTLLGRETTVLDAVINNAFGKLEDRLVDADPNAIQAFFQVSLAGTALIIKNSVPFLRASSSGRVINIVADWGFPMHNIMTGPSLYVAGKYGLHGLGAALQTELGGEGIRITNICPGIVAADVGFGDPYDNFETNHGDKAIHPEAIAASIDFVLSQRSAHIRSIVLSPRNPEYNGL